MSLSGTPSINGAAVTLTLADAVISTDTGIKVDYTKPTTGSGNKLGDAAGNEVATFTGRAVTNSVANTAPTSTSKTVTVNEDTAYTFAAGDFPFTDADSGNTLSSVTIASLPSAGAITHDGTTLSASKSVPKADIDGAKLKFVPAANANGSPYATFTFKVSDGVAESAAATMTVDVTAVADPPGTPVLAAQSATENQSFSYTFAAVTDPDGDTVTYAAALDGGGALPAWLTFTASSRTFSGTPGHDAAGSHTIRVTASDDSTAALSASATFVLTVGDVNRAPAAPVLAAQSATGEPVLQLHPSRR